MNFANQGGTLTSSVNRLENYPVKGYPYKRGIKLSYEATDNDEPHVEAIEVLTFLAYVLT
ncbi:DUF228 domain-containing protein (plasmid) [Borrelia miyamotoi]|uniref:DUF228 domain-containing protein n=2 Tax=Borrelia miyamotoi TaxID=47466 RepID=A0AAQ3CMW0_9SPIR|nr:DUF228 domain-containing protein [Borrelia miyamotoi]AHH05754.1 Hypothetical protein BOM_1211 [Borrelia miyamotoi FR64b]ATQ15346.1 DUF228 domain-containing protein [Borrelia miyamotoi]ATQ16530.1 DUF228 domain-containing protein [Borrelia miyamotoi]ATQ17676.1 DUF228 domain-containing protein [Borrelia miyamotoi]ATQ18872.1 DUF228 domain-containing protein [Borrelia miyamotoi]